MKKFINRVIPFPNESLYSVYYRLAKKNYYSHPGSMLKSIARDIYETNCNYLEPENRSTSLLLKVAEMADINIQGNILNKYDSLLVDTIPSSSKRAAKIQSHRVYQKYKTRYCPLCIKENFYHRLHWDITLITMCYHHNVRLVDSCPKCKKKVSLNRFMRRECTCGYCYSENNKYEIETNNLVVSAQRTIYERLMLMPERELPGGKIVAKDYFFFFFMFCFLMDDKDMDLFSGLHEIISNSELNFVLHNSEKHDMNMMRFISTVAHLLVTEPDKYMGELIRAWLDTKKTSRNQHKYMRNILTHEKGHIYQDTFDRFLIEQKDVYLNQLDLFKGDFEEKKYITRLEATKLLKFDDKNLSRLCAYGLVKAVKTVRGEKEVYLIEKKSVEKYRQMKKECLTLNKTIPLLGVNSRVIKELIDKDVIRAIHGPKIDGYPIWYFNRQELEIFLENLINKSIKVLDVEQKGWLSFKRSVTRFKGYNLDIGDLIKTLQEGKVEFAILNNLKNIKGIFVRESSLNSYLTKIPEFIK